MSITKRPKGPFPHNVEPVENPGRGVISARSKEMERALRRPPTHGFKPLRRALKKLGTERLDQRTDMAREAKKWKDAMTAELGGTLSVRQSTVLEMAAQCWLQVKRLDAWLGNQTSLAQHKKRTVVPVLIERDRLAQRLERTLHELPALAAAPTESVTEILNSIRETPEQGISLPSPPLMPRTT